MSERPRATQALPKGNSPSARRARAEASGKPVEPSWLRESYSCSPCRDGDHAACRHHPAGQRRLGKPTEGEPCGCEARSHPIADTCCETKALGSWSWVRCGKPVKGTLTKRRFGGGSYYEMPVCGVHLSAQRRREANDARRHEEAQARRDSSDRAQALQRSSAEWAARLRSEFGVDAEGHLGTTAGVLLVDVNPERLYALLSTVSDNLRDAGLAWHDLAGIEP